MRKRFALTLFLLSCGFLLRAQDKYATLWQQGNAFYAAKSYDSAVACYEQIAAHKPATADVYFNLGNAYYRLNKIGPAILNYERALRYAPGNKEIRENLLLTQSRIANHINTAEELFFITWWQDVTHPVWTAAWSISALVAFLLIIAYFILLQFKMPFMSVVPVQVTFVLGFLWCCFMLLAGVSAARSGQINTAVIMQNDTPMMNNDLKGKPLAQLPEGTIVTILEEKEIWTHVRIPDGRSGWIQNTLADKI